MQMLMIVSRSSLLDDLLALLAGLGVEASTHLPNVHGKGEAGAALGTFESPASNAVILAALEEDEARQVVAELEAFRDRSAALRAGGRLPLRVFLLPCTQAL
jgi:nitrogen regulatory protein P-II